MTFKLRSIVRSFVRSFIRSFVRSLGRSAVIALTHSVPTHPLTHCHSLTVTHCHSLTVTHCHSLTVTHSLSLSLTVIAIHSFIRSFVRSFTVVHCRSLTSLTHFTPTRQPSFKVLFTYCTFYQTLSLHRIPLLVTYENNTHSTMQRHSTVYFTFNRPRHFGSRQSKSAGRQSIDGE